MDKEQPVYIALAPNENSPNSETIVIDSQYITQDYGEPGSVRYILQAPITNSADDNIIKQQTVQLGGSATQDVQEITLPSSHTPIEITPGDESNVIVYVGEEIKDGVSQENVQGAENETFVVIKTSENVESSDSANLNDAQSVPEQYQETTQESTQETQQESQHLLVDPQYEHVQAQDGITLEECNSGVTDKVESKPAVKVSQVFSVVVGTLSTKLLELIPGAIEPYLHEIADKHNVELQRSDEEHCSYFLSGQLDKLAAINRSLFGKIIKDSYNDTISKVTVSTKYQKPVKEEEEEEEDVKEEVKQTYVSRSGRQIKQKTSQHFHYSNILGDGTPDATVRRKRRKMNKDKDTVQLDNGEKEEIPENGAEKESDTGKNQEDQTLRAYRVQREEENSSGKENTETQQNTEFEEKRNSESTQASNKVSLDVQIKDKKAYNCLVCKFKTNSKPLLDKHTITHSQKIRLLSSSQSKADYGGFSGKCSVPLCRYTTTNQRLLKRHLLVKHGIKKQDTTYSCELCQYSTTKYGHFLRHTRTHSSLDGKKHLVSSYECTLCEYTSVSKHLFVRHMQDRHSTRRPFLCDLCGKSFKRTDGLKLHRLIHTEKHKRVYSYYCDDPTCGKGFRTAAHLEEHRSRHSTARPYLCEICGASFKTKNIQRKHIISIHKNPRAFPCTRCEKKFNTKFALRRHERLHPPKSVFSSQLADNNLQIKTSTHNLDKTIADIAVTAPQDSTETLQTEQVLTAPFESSMPVTLTTSMEPTTELQIQEQAIQIPNNIQIVGSDGIQVLDNNQYSVIEVQSFLPSDSLTVSDPAAPALLYFTNYQS